MGELDPVQYEVFYQRLDKLLNEGKEVLRYLSGSVITREAGEFFSTAECAGKQAKIVQAMTTASRNAEFMVPFMIVSFWNDSLSFQCLLPKSKRRCQSCSLFQFTFLQQ